MDATEYIQVAAEHKEAMCHQLYDMAQQCFPDDMLTRSMHFVSNQWKSVTGGHTRAIEKGYKFVSETLLDGNLSKEEQYKKIMEKFKELDFQSAWG